MSAATTTTIVATQRNRIIRRFKEAGATTPQHTIDPATQQIRQSIIFKRLVQEGVLVRTSPHHYYLDETRAIKYREQRYRTLFIVLVIFILVLTVYLFLRWL